MNTMTRKSEPFPGFREELQAAVTIQMIKERIMVYKTKGLREQLLRASSLEEIESLLQKGKSYNFPSPRTVRRWTEAAKKRRGELNSAST